MGTYSVDSMKEYINFYKIIKKRKSKYPFAIFNTGRENQSGIHWWSFVDINLKNNLFLFDPLIIEGLKFFIVDMTKKLSMNYFIILENVKVNQIKN